MNLQKMEGALKRGGIAPLTRVRIGKFDVFMADGPMHDGMQRFGIDTDSCKDCHVLIWWIPLARHHLQPGGWVVEPTLTDRINRAKEQASKWIYDIRNVDLNG